MPPNKTINIMKITPETTFLQLNQIASDIINENNHTDLFKHLVTIRSTEWLMEQLKDKAARMIAYADATTDHNLNEYFTGQHDAINDAISLFETLTSSTR